MTAWQQIQQVTEMLEKSPCTCFCSMHGNNCDCVEPENRCWRCRVLAALAAEEPTALTTRAINLLIEWRGDNPNREWGLLHSPRIAGHMALTLRDGGFTAGGLIPCTLLQSPPNETDPLAEEVRKAIQDLQERIWGNIPN